MTALDQRFKKAQTLLKKETVDKALELFQELFNEDNQCLEFLHGLGMCHYLKQDYGLAQNYLVPALALQSNNPVLLANTAETLRRLNKPDKALALFLKAHELQAGYLLAPLGIGNCYSDLRQFDKAYSYFKKALWLKADYAPAYHYLGATLLKDKKIKEALPLLKKAISLQPDYPEAEIELALALEEQGDTTKALSILNDLMSRYPNEASLHNNIGNILKDHGKIDQAIEHFEQARQSPKDEVIALFNLSQIKKGPASADDVATLEKHLADSNIQGEERRGLHFALGKFYHSKNLHNEAFAQYEIANQQDKREAPFNTELNKSTTRGLIMLFTSDFFEQRAGFGIDDHTPVFIVGLPRSGTTLLEQTLSCHPEISGAGELSYIGDFTRQLVRRTTGENQYESAMQRLDPVTACNLASRYIDDLREKHDEYPTYITDKMPGNFQSIGFIHLLFPNAKIINCQRNPMDCGLSLFSRNFAHVISYSRKLEWIACFYNEYRKLMDHWNSILGDQIIDISYEDMVFDHQATTTRALEFLGLDWDNACTHFHKNTRTIKTASTWQVRQPLYTSSVSAWRKYEQHLQPLFHALKPHYQKEVLSFLKEKNRQ